LPAALAPLALAGLYEQPVLVHALNVALYGFGALRHGAVDPGTDLHVLAVATRRG
jgi:hypothetical protein